MFSHETRIRRRFEEQFRHRIEMDSGRRVRHDHQARTGVRHARAGQEKEEGRSALAGPWRRRIFPDGPAKGDVQEVLNYDRGDT
jgi:hypothetical protein